MTKSSDMRQPITTPTPSQDRVWPVKTLGWLFLIQAGALFGAGIFYLTSPELVTDLRLLLSPDLNDVQVGAQFRVIFNLALIPLGTLGFVAAIGFFRSWVIAWLHAMLTQGLILTLALVLHYYGEANYLAMITSMLIVLYLNYADGQANLQHKLIEAEEKGLS